jgi:hypothetical protein
MDTKLDNIVEPSAQPVLQPLQDDKKQARLLQLASARESAKTKKREREQNMSDIKSQLSSLTSALKTQTQEAKLETVVEESETKDEEPRKKRVRVTKESPIVDDEEDESEKDVEKESWTTMLLRSSALFGLGIGSWYFQNRFQRPAQIKQTAKTAQQSHKILPPLHRAVPATKVIGKSGFFM